MKDLVQVPLSNFSFIGLDFYTLTCLMMMYSFIGWLYESTIFSIAEQGKIMNRGCFVGPYCPIYSVVAVLNIYLLEGVDSNFKIVILSSLTVCAIEYVTSYTLEKLFHARYWDYSYYPLNINGRISVISGLFFGIAVLFLKKILHPMSVSLMKSIPFKIRFYLALALWFIFIMDALFTTVSMMNLNRKCKELYDAWDNYVEGKLDKLNNKKEYLNRFVIVRKGKNLVVKLKGLNKTFVALEARYLKSNPAFKSLKYGELVERIRDTARGITAKLEDYDEEIEENKDVDVEGNEAEGNEADTTPETNGKRNPDIKYKC